MTFSKDALIILLAWSFVNAVDGITIWPYGTLTGISGLAFVILMLYGSNMKKERKR